MTIERVELTNWRCHEHLEAPLKPGLNFILGPNGSGKSSLLQAIMFALTGVAESATKDAVNMGSTSGASVSVVLDGQHRRATITRSIDQRGGTHESLHAAGEGARTVSELVDVLLGAASSDLRNLLFLSEGDIYASSGDTGLSRQLEALLPLESLRGVASEAQTLRRSFDRLLKSRRGDLKLSRDEEAQLGARRSELEVALQELDDAESALRDRELELGESVRRGQEFRQAAAARASWETSARRLLADLGMLDLDLPQALENTEQEARLAEEQLRLAITQRGRLEGQRETYEATVASLKAAGEACPLCRQPLTGEHRDRLVEEQAALVSMVTAELRAIHSQIEDAEQAARQLATAADSLRLAFAQRPEYLEGRRTKPLAGHEDVSIDELDRVRSELAELRERRRPLFDELAGVREQIASSQAGRRIQDEVIDAFRRNALLEAAEQAIASFTSEIRQGLIEPLSAELGRQWKSYRPHARWNLVLDDQARLAIEMHGEMRPYSSLSAGEKTVAFVLLRMALAIAFTSTDFILLDEPLEHLDPRSRRMLVSSLHHAVEQGLIGQVIVSTYEEALVRRLQLDGRANAIYLTET